MLWVTDAGRGGSGQGRQGWVGLDRQGGGILQGERPWHLGVRGAVAPHRLPHVPACPHQGVLGSCFWGYRALRHQRANPQEPGWWRQACRPGTLGVPPGLPGRRPLVQIPQAVGEGGAQAEWWAPLPPNGAEVEVLGVPSPPPITSGCGRPVSSRLGGWFGLLSLPHGPFCVVRTGPCPTPHALPARGGAERAAVSLREAQPLAQLTQQGFCFVGGAKAGPREGGRGRTQGWTRPTRTRDHRSQWGGRRVGRGCWGPHAGQQPAGVSGLRGLWAGRAGTKPPRVQG